MIVLSVLFFLAVLMLLLLFCFCFISIVIIIIIIIIIILFFILFYLFIFLTFCHTKFLCYQIFVIQNRLTMLSRINLYISLHTSRSLVLKDQLLRLYPAVFFRFALLCFFVLFRRTIKTSTKIAYKKAWKNVLF